MVRRLVLGSGTIGRAVATAVADRSGSLRVLTADDERAADLRDGGIDVTVGDPTDPEALRAFETPDVIAIADDEGRRNLATAKAVAAVFGNAHVLAYTGLDGTDVGADIAPLVDSVIDGTQVTADYVLDRVGDDGVGIRQLTRVLRDIDRLAIVTHDNPDPDAIASAVALARIAERAGCSVDICYYGEITHHENRAFVNLLEFDLRALDPDEELEDADGIALVDHSRPGVNDGLDPDLAVDIVIDHHPPRAPVEARYVDLRSEVGATSTLLVEYLDRLGIELTEQIATGLLFGIRIDTQEFTREITATDFQAAASLVPHADTGLLERIESPSISPDTLETIANAIGNRKQHGSILLSCVGRLHKRDALAQSADRLLTLEDVSTTVVYGVMDGTVYVSARSRGQDVDLGETLRDAFSRIGSAGGHADMAGAQITLGVLEAVEERDETLMEIVEAVVTDRILDAIEARSSQTVAAVYAPEYGEADQYLVPEEERELEEE